MVKKLIEGVLETFSDNPRVAILMSGGGSNARVILENRNLYPTVKFVAIIADRMESAAMQIAETHQLQHFLCSGSVRTDSDRTEYFQRVAYLLEQNQINAILYAGFMKICSGFFVHRFPGINSHPADLTIKDEHGHPKYTGMPVIRDAIQAGESYIASTVHVVDADVDCGQPIAVSKHMPVSKADLDDIAAVHEKLKKGYEHKTYPEVIRLLSQGLLRREELPVQFNEH